MGSYRLDPGLEIKPNLWRQVAKGPGEEADLPGTASLQRDPLDQVTCRLGDASCAGAHASTLNRVTASQPTREARSVLQLQRGYGNQYVQRVLALARRAEGEAEVAPEVETAIQRERGSGQALDSGLRAQMEPAFGADFSGVRVHAGGQADALNRSLNARAFTSGQDIFFKQGEYSPGSSGGRELLAHELTHVVQQNGDQIQRKLTVGQPGDVYEKEANRVARAVVERESVQRDAEAGLAQRQISEEEEEASSPLTLSIVREGEQGTTFVSTDTITLSAQVTGAPNAGALLNQVSWTVHSASQDSGNGNPHTAASKSQFAFKPNPTNRLQTGSTAPNLPIRYRVEAQVAGVTADFDLKQDESDIIRQEYIDFNAANPPARNTVVTPTNTSFNTGNYSLIVDDGLGTALTTTTTALQQLTQAAAAPTPGTPTTAPGAPTPGTPTTAPGAPTPAPVAVPAISVLSAYRNPRRNVHVGSQYPITSKHVWGKALDLGVANPNATLWQRLRDAGASAGTSICEDGPKQKPCSDPGIDHVHIQW